MSAPQHGELELAERGSDATRTLELSGELDISTADRLQDAVTRLCVAEGARELTLDLRALTFIDSSGLAAIVYGCRLCERYGCELSVIRGPQSVQEVFELTGLTELLPFRAVGDRSSRS
jgi:anti-sigma B factor antagonist